MDRVKGQYYHRKGFIFVILVFTLCFFCFAVSTPRIVNATENVLENETGTAENGTLEGNLGGFTFQFGADGTGSLPATLQIVLILTVIALAPTILLMVTSFTRILITLHFVRTALGTQTTPPNQVMIGLALFLTLFIMSPVMIKINTEALQPFSRGEINAEQAFERGLAPLRSFMFDQMEGSEKDLKLFLDIAGIEEVNNIDEIPTTVLIPSFIISELRKAFIMGFLLYIPFVIIDMVVASTLMSMGMMMLPPTTISMPFKILLFVIADGWSLLIGAVVKTFY